jgi:hypothetical protein
MSLDADALNYPYIRIRDVEWLKRTLLVFPHVVRIAPTYGAPEDSPEVAAFRNLNGRRGPLPRNVDLESSNIWNDQMELKSRVANELSADRAKFVGRFGRRATLDNAGLVDESTSLWDNRLASRTFQLHGQKVVADLLDFLLQNDLAWNPRHSDGFGYIEMHPRLGEAVLATLAFACAKNEGLRLVTEFPQIYGRTIHRSKEEIFQSCLDLNPRVEETGEPFPAPASLAEFVVYHRCDASKLTPETLLALNMEWEAIGAFKEGLEKLTADIPTEIESPRVLSQRLAEKADRMFVRWKEDNKNWSQRLKELFSGDLDDTAKVLDKLVEKAFGGEATAGGAVGSGALGAGLAGTILGGNVTHHALLGAGAGLALELVVRTGKNIVAMKKKRREDPLRYLTMMEKSGVSYITSN